MWRYTAKKRLPRYVTSVEHAIANELRMEIARSGISATVVCNKLCRSATDERWDLSDMHAEYALSRCPIGKRHNCTTNGFHAVIEPLFRRSPIDDIRRIRFNFKFSRPCINCCDLVRRKNKHSRVKFIDTHFPTLLIAQPSGGIIVLPIMN